VIKLWNIVPARFLAMMVKFRLVSIWNIVTGKLDSQVKHAGCFAIEEFATCQFAPEGNFQIDSSATPPPLE
jgi:hypothetical protein